VKQGATQGQQVANDRLIDQRLELYRLKADPSRSQRAADVNSMLSLAHEHRDRLVRIAFAVRRNQSGDLSGFLRRVQREAGVDVDCGCIARIASRGATCVTDRTAGKVVPRRQCSGEHFIEPVHELGHRAEIVLEPERHRSQGSEPEIARAQKEPDLGMPEAIDRLHRIADAEERAPVAIAPPP
jgi:hypothetical protein